MSNTKVCPACQKLLPVLAVRCKFCGFKQPLNRNEAVTGEVTRDSASESDAQDTASGEVVQKSTLPPAGMAREKSGATKTIGSSDPKRARIDKAKTGLGSGLGNGHFGDGARQSSKKTLLGPGVLDSAAGQRESLGAKGSFSTKTSTAPLSTSGNSRSDKKTPDKKKPSPIFQGPMTDINEKPKAAGTLSSAAPAPPFSGRPSRAPTRSATTPVSTAPPVPGATEDSDILSLDDDSQLVMLASDQSGTMELDLDNLPSEISEETPGDDAAKNVQTELPPLAKLARTAVQTALAAVARIRALGGVSVSWITRLMRQALPLTRGVLSRFGGVSVKVWAIAGGVLLVLGIAIALLLSSGTEEPAVSKPKPVVARADTRKVESKTRSAAATPAKSSAKPVAVPAGAEKRQCRAASDYAPFMWQKDLISLLDKAGVKGVCDIMGQSFAVMSAAFASLNPVMSSGLDGVPDSATLTIVPEDAARADAIGITFAFYETKLFRVILDYGAAREIDFDLDRFKAVFETEAEKNSVGDMTVYGFSDGDVRIELVQHRGDVKRRELQFTAANLDVGLEKKLTEQRNADRYLARANGYMLRQQYSNAADAFQLAADASELCGAAWVGRATAQLYLEDFTGARAAADRALKVVDDSSIHAQASHVLAVISLRSGDVKGAIAMLEKAVANDAQNADAALALGELKTGTYGTDRVAMTAARMSCLQKLGATLEGVLARGNFPDTNTFFKSLKTAKMDVAFERRKQEWVSRECR